MPGLGGHPVNRFPVVVAALFILAAGAYGAARGYAFTDLDKAPPGQLPAVAVVTAVAAPKPLELGYDERAIREVTRGEVRGLIRQHLSAARTRPVEAAPSTETLSSEMLPAAPPAAAAGMAACLRDFARLNEGENAAVAYRERGVEFEFPYSRASFKDRYTRQHRNRPCSTIVAHLSKDGLMFIHPVQNRSLTPREAARVQSFPDWFVFPEARTHSFRLIGNAVQDSSSN